MYSAPRAPCASLWVVKQSENALRHTFSFRKSDIRGHCRSTPGHATSSHRDTRPLPAGSPIRTVGLVGSYQAHANKLELPACDFWNTAGLPRFSTRTILFKFWNVKRFRPRRRRAAKPGVREPSGLRREGASRIAGLRIPARSRSRSHPCPARVARAASMHRRRSPAEPDDSSASTSCAPPRMQSARAQRL